MWKSALVKGRCVGPENIGAGSTIKCYLIFCMDSNIMNIKEQMCFQKSTYKKLHIIAKETEQTEIE